MIRRLLRVFKILSVVLRYGLDNIAMSGVTPRIALLTNRLLFWRDLSAPRGERRLRANHHAISTSALGSRFLTSSKKSGMRNEQKTKIRTKKSGLRW